MKILHVQATLAPSYGGPASVLPRLAKAQAAAGHEVVVATTTADHPRGAFHAPGWDTLGDSAVRVYYGAVQFAPLRVSAGLAALLRRTISDFDVVHVHGIYRFPTTYAAHLARRRGVPYIIRPYGSLDPYLFARSTTGQLHLKRLYEHWFDLPNLHGADAIHYTAEEERERASFLNLQSSSFIVPNGLDWESYRTLPDRGALRTRWGIGDAPVVLFLGRLHPKKGLDLLVPAFDEVRKREPTTQLVIAGPENDDYGQKVRGWVTERALDAAVHFVGPLHGADVVQAYVDADVFVLPSYTENFGMTVVEAMACALPVVISDQVNIHAEISSNAVGLVTRCDADEVASGLLTLLRDVDRRHTMGSAGREFVQSRYMWPAIVDALTNEYEAVIERSRGPAAPRSRSPLRNAEMKDLHDKAGKLARIVVVPVWRRALLRHRVLAGVEHAPVLRNMPGLQTIVDGGANRGQFALAARHCFPEAQLISFEPLPGPAAEYEAIFARDPRTTMIVAALGPESGNSLIHISGRDDSSSLLPITAEQNALFPGTAEVGTAIVRVTRLAERLPGLAIAAPALLKLDVQGFELQALVGCEDVLDRFAWVYVECSFVELYSGQALADEVTAWLEKRGFGMRGVYHMTYDAAGRAVQGDFLFARRVG